MTPVYDQKWKIFGLVATSIFMSTLDSSIVNVALPYIMQDLGTDIRTVQWVVLIYLVTVSALLLTFGRLSDIKGRKSIYIWGFGIFSAGSFLCGLAGTSYLLIAARALQGCGAAMLMACSPALIVDAFPPKERGRALGLIGAVVAAGLTTGPVIGGMILEYLSWPYIFFINIPIGMIAIFGGGMVLGVAGPVSANSESMDSEPMDRAGSALLILILSSLILFLNRLSVWDPLSGPSLALAAVCVTAGVGFWIVETRTAFPLFDLSLLKIRLFLFPVMSAAILFAALFVVVFMMPFYLTYPCGFSASRTGLIMIAPFMFLLVVSPVSGMLYDRFASRILCGIGMVILGISLASLMQLQPGMNISSILWRMGLAGMGTAFFVSPNNTAVMSCVPMSRRGIASGAVATSRNLGMVLGVALAGLVFSHRFSQLSGGQTLEHYTASMEPFFMAGFRQTMGMGVGLAATGFIVSFARGKERRQFS